MFYSMKMAEDLGYKTIDDLVEDYIRRHNNCSIRYVSNGVYLDHDLDSEPGMPNIGEDDFYKVTINTQASLKDVANIFGVSIKDVLEGKLGILVLEEDESTVTAINRKAVHAAHCCKWHGCKYGDEDCPVVTGVVEQEYLCEYCDEDLENEEYHRQVLKDIEEMKKFKR